MTEKLAAWILEFVSSDFDFVMPYSLNLKRVTSDTAMSGTWMLIEPGAEMSDVPDTELLYEAGTGMPDDLDSDTVLLNEPGADLLNNSDTVLLNEPGADLPDDLDSDTVLLNEPGAGKPDNPGSELQETVIPGNVPDFVLSYFVHASS